MNRDQLEKTHFAGSSKARASKFPTNTDTLFFFAKSSQRYAFNQQFTEHSPEYIERFKIATDNDACEPWQSVVTLETYSDKLTLRRQVLEEDRGKLHCHLGVAVLVGVTNGI
ncbi:MAG: hypothetical protein U5L04_01110 [Trueperaceae bacterium]|nr:hypothetical protein [Trueperaceae bacterium]